MMWGYEWNGPGMLMMTLSSLLWLALIALLIWAIVHWLTKKGDNTITPAPSAMEILRRRYARGEIDSETFERMREQLEPGTREPVAQKRQPPS